MGCAWLNCCYPPKEAAGTPCGLVLFGVSPCLYNGDGVCSMWVVHGGTAVDPPLRRQQVLHVVLIYSEPHHTNYYVIKKVCALYGLCMEELLLTLR